MPGYSVFWPLIFASQVDSPHVMRKLQSVPCSHLAEFCCPPEAGTPTPKPQATQSLQDFCCHACTKTVMPSASAFFQFLSSGVGSLWEKCLDWQPAPCCVICTELSSHICNVSWHAHPRSCKIFMFLHPALHVSTPSCNSGSRTDMISRR